MTHKGLFRTYLNINMKLFMKIVNGFQLLTNFPKSSILDVFWDLNTSLTLDVKMNRNFRKDLILRHLYFESNSRYNQKLLHFYAMTKWMANLTTFFSL